MITDSLKILLVIPVYNHGQTLKTVVDKGLASGWPILVIDDGSTDNGPDSLKDLDIQIHRLEPNQGKGAAILAAIAIARNQGYQGIVTVDADNQLDPSETINLVKALDSWPQMVIGSRLMDPEKVPGSSLFGRSFSNFWVKVETGIELPDTQSGFRLYPVEQISEIKIKSRRYDFEIESLVRLCWAGIPIKSVDVSVDYPKGELRKSHFHKFKDNFRLSLLHTRLVLRTLNPWPQKKIKKKETNFTLPQGSLNPLKLLKQLCREHTSTAGLAAAVWIGFFLGALPLLAFHTIAIIFVTHRLHLNKLAAVGASQFCMPPLVPALCIEVGYFLRNGHFLIDATWETLIIQAPQRLFEYFIGSLIIGPVLGAAGAIITYWSVRFLRRSKNFPKAEEA
jgi:glycosyltransferase involved in cell wall biosynthesis